MKVYWIIFWIFFGIPFGILLLLNPRNEPDWVITWLAIGVIYFTILLFIQWGINISDGYKFKKVTIDLGQITEFNDVVQKFIKTNDKITVHAFQRDFTTKEIFTRSDTNLKYAYKDISFVVKGHTYTIDEIKRFEITESESIKKSHEIDNTINGRSISSAAAYSRDLNESRRIVICFSNENCFVLSNVNNSLALSIQLAIIKKHSEPDI